MHAVAILVGRWGGWPSWLPLWLHTLSASSTIDFHLLTDAPLPASAPNASNVIVHMVTIADMLRRLQDIAPGGVQLGVTTDDITAGLSERAYSGALLSKISDFKPMWGEIFDDILAGYAWWGYLQEDVLLGDLRAFLRPALLEHMDVIVPSYTGKDAQRDHHTGETLKASGVFMLYRNRGRVNNLWRRSANASEVLSSSTYYTFDEWWGRSRDNIAVVIEREEAQQRLRVHFSWNGAEEGIGHWLVDDTFDGWKTMIGRREVHQYFVACWRRGVLWINVQPAGKGRSARRCLCTEAERCSATPGQAAMVHLANLKREPAFAHLRLDTPGMWSGVSEFTLTRHGLWMRGADAASDVLYSGSDATLVGHALRQGFVAAVGSHQEGKAQCTEPADWQLHCALLAPRCVAHCQEEAHQEGDASSSQSLCCLITQCCHDRTAT